MLLGLKVGRLLQIIEYLTYKIYKWYVKLKKNNNFFYPIMKSLQYITNVYNKFNAMEYK